MPKKLSVNFRRPAALIINRVAFRDKKLVYVARANKKFRYPWGRSRIVYFGTTKKGARRIAWSAAGKGADVLFNHGVKHLELIVVVCGKTQGIETWKKLERALIIRFREKLGAPPKANATGRNMRWRDERNYFSDKKLDKIIDGLG
ncbi:MAG: hypothetical protein ACREIG_08155 [Nitrospiraceae bacterium]